MKEQLVCIEFLFTGISWSVCDVCLYVCVCKELMFLFQSFTCLTMIDSYVIYKLLFACCRRCCISLLKLSWLRLLCQVRFSSFDIL